MQRYPYNTGLLGQGRALIPSQEDPGMGEILGNPGILSSNDGILDTVITIH